MYKIGHNGQLDKEDKIVKLDKIGKMDKIEKKMDKIEINGQNRQS